MPTTSSRPDEWQALKRILLATGGLLHDDAEMSEYDTEQPEEWLAYMTQNVLFNSTANFGSGLAWTWRMFGELAVDDDREWNSPTIVGPSGGAA